MVRASYESVGSGRDPKVALGTYHFVVNAAEEHTSTKGNSCIRLEVEVLDGTVPDQQGKTMKYQDFYPKAPTFFDLAAALGLTDQTTGHAFTPAMLKQMRDEAKATGKPPAGNCDFSAAECVGRQFFANVVTEKDQDGKVKDFPRIGMNIFSVVDEKAASVPKNQAMIDQLLGGGEPVGGLSGANAYD